MQGQGFAAVYFGDDRVLLGQRALQTRRQRVPVQQVADANAGASGLVHVGRPYAAARGANGAGTASLLFQAVQHHVVGHDHVGAFANVEPGGIDPPGGQVLQLADEDVRIDHHTIANDAVHIGPADARRNQVKLEGALVVDDGVAGVVAPGVANYAIHLAGKVIDHLALAPRLPTVRRSRHMPALLIAFLNLELCLAQDPLVPPEGAKANRSIAN